ncbi:MAG: glycosyl hydrolase [Planctomycetota bacterium]|nr:glycosyl hydrolase [Planctomycetota bacterium]
MKKTMIAVLLMLASVGSARAADAEATLRELEKSFVQPPESARPWVYWFWLNSNITREGITADLEAMKRAGIGGVLIMEVDQGAPVGPVAFMGPQWRELFKHVVAEAQRLGLEVNMNNDAGWNGSGGPWIKPELSMQTVVWGETTIEGPKRFEEKLPQPKANHGFYRDIAVLAFPTPGEFRIADIKGKALYERRGVPPAAETKVAPEMAIARERMVDLTAKMDKDAHLAWEVPAGKWTLMRIGHTTTGAVCGPAPASGSGLECDKLSKEGIEAQFAGMMAKLIEDSQPLAGKALAATHIDSWEIGCQNWTARMREEFQKRRGYDSLQYLPAITGRVVDSLEVSERFLWDLRQTVSDLLADNYAGHLAKLAQQHGMRLSIEAYDGPCDDLTYAGRADEPMCEFWMGGGRFETCKEMSSAAHTYGHRVVGAEAFTADDHERWLQHPATIKSLGDRAFCDGVNRFVFHRYAMQPWLNYEPGMTMGPWGLHYERTQTWWEQSKPWHEYLARCQFLLRQGLFVADVCYLQPEAAPQGFQGHNCRGYDYDNCTPETVLTRMSVKDGRIVLPDGMSYRLLVLPNVTAMTPPLLGKIKELVQAGAVVIGPRPQKSPSLSDYPKCDEDVRRLGEELWGDCDGKAVKEHACGKGRIIWGLTPEEVLAQDKVPADFTAGPFVRWIHRSVEGAEIYFVASSSPQPADTLCTFRVTGKRPELWQPDTGQLARVPSYEEADGCTRIPIHFEPRGSVFVVFRGEAPQPSERIISVTRDGQELLRMATAPAVNRDVTNTFTMSVWVKPDADTPLPPETNTGITSYQLERNDVLFPPPGHEVYSEGHAGAGIAAGRNGVCVHEHGASYFPALLVYAAPLTNWTHIAVVYSDGTPSLYLNGKLARQGLKSPMIVHPGVGVPHNRSVTPFKGQVAGLQQFDHALTEAEIAKLAASPPAVSERRDEPELNLVSGEVWRAGKYAIKTADGKSVEFQVASLPEPLEITGPWEVRFPPNRGAPETITLDKLASWSEHGDPGVKYFSGAATYAKSINVPPEMLGKNRRLYLDLGKVQAMAEVKMNGKDLGTLWKPPFRVDITGAAAAGNNALEVKVVNLWINRMLGDEQLPEDCDRNPNGTLKKWPQWVLDGKRSPTGRFTFTTWKLWKKDAPLQESGLLGPVTVRVAARTDAK